MTLKEQIHVLVDELPDDSKVLKDFRETLRLNQALAEAYESSKAGRVYSAEEFVAKVNEKWPRTGPV